MLLKALFPQFGNLKTGNYSPTPYRPELAPSDYHLFGYLKEAQHGTHYTNDDAEKSSTAWSFKEHMGANSMSPTAWSLGLDTQACTQVQEYIISIFTTQ